MLLRVTELPGFRLKVESDESSLIDWLRKDLEYIETVMAKHDGKVRPYPVTRQLYESHLEYELIIRKGLWSQIMRSLAEFKVVTSAQIEPVFNFNLSFEFKPASDLNATLYRDQIEKLSQLAKGKMGCAQLPTASGKTEIIVYMVKSFLENHLTVSENVLIAAPSVLIRNQIIERAEIYGLTLCDNFTEQATVIHPVSLFNKNSKKVNDPVIQRYLKGVKLIITDEVHHSRAASWGRLYDACENVEYSYGVSATIDKPSNSTKSRLDHLTGSVMKYCGELRVRETPKSYNKELQLFRLEQHYTLPSDGRDFLTEYTAQFNSPAFLLDIETILNNHPDVIFYIPVVTVQSGKSLYDYLQARQIQVIYYHSGSWHPNTLTSLKDAQEQLQARNFRAFISTSAAGEGVDFQAIAGAVLSYGTNFIPTLQNVGRARQNRAVIINVGNKASSVLYSQYKTREKDIVNSYSLMI